MLEVRRRPDITFVHVESWRWDALTSELMPKTSAWRSRCYVPPRHYSTGNGTATGTFGVATGLSAAFYEAATSQKTPALPLLALGAAGYARHLWFPNEALKFDGVLESVFGSTVTLHTFEGLPVHTADAAVTKAFLADLGRDTATPRFDYVVLDSSHYDYSYPPAFERYLPTETLGLRFNPRTGEGVSSGNAPVVVTESARAGGIFNRYKNAVGYVDTLIDAILQARLGDDAHRERIVVVFGDHGEEFWDGGRGFGHASNLADPQTRVPLLLCGVSVPTSTYAITSHADVMPTILDAIGARARRPFMTGKSWLGYAPREDVAVLRYKRHSPSYVLVTPAAKYSITEAEVPAVLWTSENDVQRPVSDEEGQRAMLDLERALVMRSPAP
jgi:membrane-anchored protein YejM (alkaline phosphatase superfamily)